MVIQYTHFKIGIKTCSSKKIVKPFKSLKYVFKENYNLLKKFDMYGKFPDINDYFCQFFESF